ncbi:MAG: arsenate reductase ArsC [Woeseia sp.]
MPNRNTLHSSITVLILCTGNSARSILGESLVNALGAPHFLGLSAGSKPAGRVHPGALRVLRAAGHATGKLRSKSWDEFASGAPVDIVITVCDSAAAETCPVFPGAAVRSHWGIPDPAAAADQDAAFARAFDVLQRRIARLTRLSLADLSASEQRAALDDIAKQESY